MTTGAPHDAPRLAAPGAGLPAPELFIARILFRIHRWRTDRAASSALVRSECTAITALTSPRAPAAASQPVLIRRLPGMEDSSRYWSVCMTLDHLAIVNTAVAGVIAALGAGRTPPGTASTAAVKPRPEAGPEVLDTLPASCTAIEAAVAGIPDLRTARRYSHPWFGPLDAASWHAMAGFHMRLHRRQVAAILAAL